MDFFENDLQCLIENARAFNLNEEHIITIAYNILCAMYFIHSSGVMHRDLKPANILIDDKCKIKICDFGLSRCGLNKNSDQSEISSSVAEESKTSTLQNP